MTAADEAIYSPSWRWSNRLKCVSSYGSAVTVRGLDEDVKGEENEPADGHSDYFNGYSSAVYEKIRNDDRRAYE